MDRDITHNNLCTPGGTTKCFGYSIPYGKLKKTHASMSSSSD